MRSLRSSPPHDRFWRPASATVHLPGGLRRRPPLHPVLFASCRTAHAEETAGECVEDILSLELPEGWRIDVRNREAHRNGELVALTQRETELLCFLGVRAGEFVSKEVLLRDVWGYRSNTETRAISNCIRRLRKKLGDDPRNSTILESKYGGSLRLVEGTVSRASPVSTIYTRGDTDDSGALPVWWPSTSDRPDRRLTNLCGRMEDIAVALHHNHIGVEHLIDAMARERAASGPVTLWVSTRLASHRARFALPELSPVDLPDAAMHFTPRMQRASQGPGYTIDLETLLSRLFSKGGLAATLQLERMPGGADVPFGGAILGLEVVGGPEDGRRITPKAGETIGRAAPEEGPDNGLYGSTGLIDRRLSRQHFVWLGAGRMELRKRGVVERSGLERTVGAGEVLLEPQDRLRFGAGTWLRPLTAHELRNP